MPSRTWRQTKAQKEKRRKKNEGALDAMLFLSLFIISFQEQVEEGNGRGSAGFWP